MLAACLFFVPLNAFASATNEDKIKAAYIYNFLKFVTWPDTSFADAKSPLRVCVAGEGTVPDLIKTLIAGKEVKGRTVEVQNASSSGCHLLFVSSSADAGDSIGAPGVVTVGEVEGFAANGGVFNFVNIDGKVKVELNQKAAKHSGIQVSAKLQQISIRIES